MNEGAKQANADAEEDRMLALLAEIRDALLRLENVLRFPTWTAHYYYTTPSTVSAGAPNNGYQCGSCRQWVPYGASHMCGSVR